MGTKRGRGESLPLAEAFRAVPNPEVTYELLRRVEANGHATIGPKAVRTLATMLDVDENTIREAARQRPALGRFELPERADKLEPSERAVIVSVVDAILRAGEGRIGEQDDQESTKLAEVTPIDSKQPARHEDVKAAHRKQTKALPSSNPQTGETRPRKPGSSH
jgi:hypothetical protein